MTASKFNFLTWLIFIQFPAYIILDSYLIIDTLGTRQTEPVKHEFILLAFLLIVLIFFIFAWLLFFKLINRIVIDQTNQLIFFKNILTQNEKRFSFKELSGYYSSIKTVGSYGTQTKILLIIKDNKLGGKISSMYYSNFSDMEKAMVELPFLGQIKYSDIKSIKINLLNSSVE